MATADTLKAAIGVIETLKRSGHQAYLVGGCVRDTLLGKQPKDYDVATSAVPRAVEDLFAHTVPIGKDFGVIQVLVMETHTIEVATFRSDGVYTDGRRPDDVKYSDTPDKDVKRRDFTMNGLLMTENDKIIDLVGGHNDISDKLIRAIGNPVERFTEDALRMVRAIRFACQLGFSIEPKTWAAIRDLAKNIQEVSAERKRDELTKILTSGKADYGLFLLNQIGALEHMCGDGYNSVDLHCIRAAGHLEKGCDIRLALATLGIKSDIAKDTLKYSRAVSEAVDQIYQHRLNSFCNYDIANRAKAIRHPLHLLRKKLYEIECYIEETPENYHSFLVAEGTVPTSKIVEVALVNGNDLKKVGAEESKAMARVLEDVENAQLNGQFSTKEAGIEYALTKFPGLFDQGTRKYARICPRCKTRMTFKVSREIDGSPKMPTKDNMINCADGFISGQVRCIGQYNGYACNRGSTLRMFTEVEL